MTAVGKHPLVNDYDDHTWQELPPSCIEFTKAYHARSGPLDDGIIHTHALWLLWGICSKIKSICKHCCIRQVLNLFITARNQSQVWVLKELFFWRRLYAVLLAGDKYSIHILGLVHIGDQLQKKALEELPHL